jgi:hypothetical protein
MRYLTCLLATLCFAALSPTLADEPPLPTPPPIEPTPAQPQVAGASTATVSAPSKAAASSAKAPSAKDAEAAAAQDKRLRSQGYKPVVRNGITQYCRNEATVGTRFSIPVCGTPDELDKAALSGKELTESIQRGVMSPRSN